MDGTDPCIYCKLVPMHNNVPNDVHNVQFNTGFNRIGASTFSLTTKKSLVSEKRGKVLW